VIYIGFFLEIEIVILFNLIFVIKLNFVLLMLLIYSFYLIMI